MNYTKHEIKRIRDLNSEWFELVFTRNSLKFSPGDCIKLYQQPNWNFIASSPREPWIRLILNRDVHPNFVPGHKLSVKFNLELFNPLTGLDREDKPAFLVTTKGIGAFFSWVSMYPTVKCRIAYLGDNKVQEDWIKQYHEIVNNPEDLIGDTIYAVGQKDLLHREAEKVLNVCKSSYLF